MTTTSTRGPGAGGTTRSRTGKRKPAAAARPEPDQDAKNAAKTAAKTATKTASKPASKPAAKPASKAAAKTASKARPAAVRQAAPPRTPFVLLIVGLMGGALVSLLLLNTVLAEDSFRLTELQRNNKLLDQQRQALEREIAREESPERLRQKAEALGMELPERSSYIDPMTGQVTEVGGAVRPLPNAAAAAAAAAGAVGVPAVVVPGQGVPTAPGGRSTAPGTTTPGATTPGATAPRDTGPGATQQTPRTGAGTP
ncbi:FtsB/FtsL family cell division protein [Actinomadura rudentiformis]|uniref:hypothetical protein n=1 Tax=Actinomadura rudentiformis TaxID=359158 RepID=UPI00178C34A9|nr:hypothetical protein [Actinomadura rudentiformis]